MTLLWRSTKSAASMSPCIALIFSLMYANMAALFSKKVRQSGPTNYSREETSQRPLNVVLL